MEPVFLLQLIGALAVLTTSKMTFFLGKSVDETMAVLISSIKNI